MKGALRHAPKTGPEQGCEVLVDTFHDPFRPHSQLLDLRTPSRIMTGKTNSSTHNQRQNVRTWLSPKCVDRIRRYEKTLGILCRAFETLPSKSEVADSNHGYSGPTTNRAGGT